MTHTQSHFTGQSCWSYRWLHLIHCLQLSKPCHTHTHTQSRTHRHTFLGSSCTHTRTRIHTDFIAHKITFLREREVCYWVCSIIIRETLKLPVERVCFVYVTCKHSGVFAAYVMERVYFVCAGHFTGILLGLLYIRWRGYILCVQAFWWVCCLSDGEGIFCVCWSLCRHTGGFAVYLTERIYSMCAGHWCVSCISDGEGIFCVCRSLGRHTGVLTVYLMDSCLSDREGIFCVCRSLGRHTSGFAVYNLTERVYFVCAGHLAGILVDLLYIWWRGYILCVQVTGGFAVYLMERAYFVCAGHLAGFLVC